MTLGLFEPLMRITNGLITLVFFPLLYNFYRKTKRRFFLYWGLGFLLYGINIMLRVIAPEIIVSRLTLFIFFLTTSGFILIVTGIGELIKKTRLVLSATLILPVLLLIQYVLGGNWQYFIWFIVLSPYVFIVVSLILIMRVYHYDLKMLIAGWSSVLILNMAFAFEMMNPGFVDLLSAVAKVTIYWGMTQPNFAFIVDDLNRFILGGIATEYHELITGQFTLVNLQNTTKDKEISWIKDRINYNSRKGIRTIIISYYDLITPDDISFNDDSEDSYFVRVQMGSRGAVKAFEDKVITINDDLTQIDLLFSDIIKLSTERQISCELILSSLSTIIHTHGWKRMYSFMTSMIPSIKNSSVNLTMFYYPETHETRANIVKFEIMADNVIQK